MQPTEQQVQRSLEALRRADPDGVGGHGVGGHCSSEICSSENREARTWLDEVPSEVFWLLEQAPTIRAERLERARKRLASGQAPTAEVLAALMVGRLVCDRLR